MSKFKVSVITVRRIVWEDIASNANRAFTEITAKAIAVSVKTKHVHNGMAVDAHKDALMDSMNLVNFAVLVSVSIDPIQNRMPVAHIILDFEESFMQ